MEYHVFGDTGAHYKHLKRGLVAVGMNPDTHKLPDNVTVIHCGDLIHKGESTSKSIRLAGNVMDANPGRYIQLIGNHEAQYLGGHHFWHGNVRPESVTTLRDWYEQGRLRIAYGIPEGHQFTNLTPEGTRPQTYADKSILLTHAGVTHDFHKKFISDFLEATDAADALNRIPRKFVFRPGEILHPFTSSETHPAGPIWASSENELWGTWVTAPDGLPFHQVHGHSSSYRFHKDEWNPWIRYNNFKRNSRINKDAEILSTKLGDALLIEIDPNYGTATPTFHPLQHALHIMPKDTP